ncbi:MAG: hypothetical protein HYX24_03295 [Candidatus Aenigmarchaeota archaeon]|nr:hypothetical protein [Candidatus Aenigmarchaeota archaeon]
MLIIVGSYFFLRQPTIQPCPKEIVSMIPHVKSIEKCYSNLENIDGEKVRIWTVKAIRSLDWDLSMNQDYLILERNVSTERHYYLIPTESVILTPERYEISAASLQLSPDAKWVRGSCFPYSDPPILRFNTTEMWRGYVYEEYIKIRKIDNEFYAYVDINHNIDEKGCILHGKADIGITTSKNIVSILTNSTSPFSVNVCQLVENEERDECLCTFALYQTNFQLDEFVPNGLKAIENMSNHELAKECEYLMRNQSVTMSMGRRADYPEKFAQMENRLIPKLMRLHVCSVLRNFNITSSKVPCSY